MKEFLFEIISEWSEDYGKKLLVWANSEEEAEEILGRDFWGEKIKYLGVYNNSYT